MVAGAVISGLILIESREIFQGLLSKPFVISLLLISLGFTPLTVILTAFVTHLIYLSYAPSGASGYPEYPFAFFSVLYSAGPERADSALLFIIILIILIARTASFAVYFKRKLFYSKKHLFIYLKGVPSVLKTVVSGSVLYFIFSFLVILVLRPVFTFIGSTGAGSHINLSESMNSLLILSLVLIIYYITLIKPAK